MIKEVLLALNERSGLSPYAIEKYMEEKHKDVLPLQLQQQRVMKKVGPKKTKKSTPAKPKQPKLIKSPTAKRAKRTIA
ncbi:histone H1-like [Quercus robur]|uniref:histone H1-like n=1 Tax=Quercus robur TaxID=38942 RepID=UPI0021615454|nr:histone H1-like [Quercus robur]